MNNLNKTYRSSVVSDELVLAVELGQEIDTFSHLYLTSMEAKISRDINITPDEFSAYLKSVLTYSNLVRSGQNVRDKHLLNQLYVPSFIEACVAYMDCQYHIDSGFTIAWRVDYTPLDLTELVGISLKLAAYSRLNNDLILGVDFRARNSNQDMLYVNYVGNIRSYTDTADARACGISAVLGVSIAFESEQLLSAFRYVPVDRMFACQEVLNAVTSV